MAATMLVDIGDQVRQEIDAARRSVEASFEDLRHWLTPPQDQRRLWDVEQALWKRLWALGCALLTLWFATRCLLTVARRVRGPDGRFYRWHGLRMTVAKTIFGEVAGHRAPSHRQPRHTSIHADSLKKIRCTGCCARRG